MTKHRNLALVDSVLPYPEYPIASNGWRDQARAKLLLALELVEQHGFTISFNAAPNEALRAFYKKEAMRLLCDINPMILADDATRRIVIAEGYDYCLEFNPDGLATYEAENEQAQDLRGAPLVRAFYKMQHQLFRVREL